MNRKKGFSTLLGILLTLVVSGGGVYFYTESNKSVTPIEESAVSTSTSQLILDQENSKKIADDVSNQIATQKVDIKLKDLNDKNKILEEAQSGFSITYPQNWGEPKIETNFSPGKNIISGGHKSYGDPLAFTGLFEPEVKIYFPSLNDSKNNIYNPEIFLLNKNSLEDGLYKDQFTETITKYQAYQDSGILSDTRKKFLDCPQVDMFWYFGYCKGKILNPVSIVNSKKMILGFMPYTIGTSYDYAFVINGSEYYGLIWLRQNSQSDFYKNNVFLEKSQPLSINHFRTDGSIDVVRYDALIETFMNSRSSVGVEDRNKFLSEIGPVLESIIIK